MPVPPEYQRATVDFYAFLVDARDTAGLSTTHQAYTMVQGVLQAFRRHLDVRDALRFAGALPPLLRALFVSDWETEETKRPFEDLVKMTKEVQSLRADHNFSPDTAIHDVAGALSRHIDFDLENFNRIVATLPKGAAEFWKSG